MRHLVVERLARLTLYATLAQGALACGADSDHVPPISAPTGPVGPVVSEGGSSNGGASSGGTNPGASAAPNATSGAVGANSFATGGDGSAGGDPFGIAGSGTGRDQFGIAGAPSPFGGTGSF